MSTIVCIPNLYSNISHGNSSPGQIYMIISQETNNQY